MQLIYHRIESSKAASPFDEALQSVVNGAQHVRLASPYIGLNFLQRTLKNTNDWRLLSDVEAWLQSVNRQQRAKCWKFIAENLDCIRHVAGLHAKVAIGNDKLFMGSANFTEKGMLARAELSVLVTSLDLVNEATAWFDALWDIASPPILDEGDALVSALDFLAWTQPRVRVKLTSTAPQIAAVLTETKRPDGFDLAGIMAKVGISESVTQSSLEESYQRISDAWLSAGSSFTFLELVDAVNRLSSGSVRDIWQLVTAETINHWLGGLDPDGFDRFVYTEGQFKPFGASGYNVAMLTPAHILSFLLEALPMFPKHEMLPFEDAWLGLGVPESHILPIVESLLSAGLLIEHDTPGEIETYSLDPYFDWPHRWSKFVHAKELFTQMKKSILDAHELRVKEHEVDEDEVEEVDVVPRTINWKRIEAISRRKKKKSRPT